MEDFGYKFDPSKIVMLEGEAAEKASILRKNGVHVPAGLASEIAKPLPSRAIQEWAWWAHFAPRPTARTAPDAYEMTLTKAQELWDKSKQHVDAMLELRAEREAEAATEAKAKADADQVRREQQAAEVKEELRERYLSLPGTTETDFEAAYPELLADHRRQLMASHATDDERAREGMRAAIRAAF